jgi:predicted RNase H-like nuclease (RuvC/YqgF family)
MTPAEVIAEMRIISAEPLSESVVRWADSLEAAMRDKDEELDFLRSVKESRGKELGEKDAEIERLTRENAEWHSWAMLAKEDIESLRQQRDNIRNNAVLALRALESSGLRTLLEAAISASEDK